MSTLKLNDQKNHNAKPSLRDFDVKEHAEMLRLKTRTIYTGEQGASLSQQGPNDLPARRNIGWTKPKHKRNVLTLSRMITRTLC